MFLPGPFTETANYSACAQVLGISADAVKQLVKRLRQRFGQLLHDQICQSVDGEPDVAFAKLLLCQALETSVENQEGT